MLPSQVIRGVVWAGLGGWAGSVVSLAAFVVTARILGPEPYGVIAFALVFVAIPQLFVGKAAVETLVQRESLTDDQSTSALILVTGAAIVSVALAALAGVGITVLLDQHTFGAVLPVFALLLVPEALKSAPIAMLKRQFKFADVAAAEAIALSLAGIAGAACAMAGLGVWSLVVAAITQPAVGMALAWLAAGWRPTGRFRPSALRELSHFSTHVFISDVLYLATNQLQRVIIGAVLGLEALGIFVFAWNLFERLKHLILGPIDAVALPAISRLRHDTAVFRTALLRAIEFNAAVTFPVFIGAAAVGSVAIPLIFGPKWVAASTVVQVVLLIGVRAAVTSMNGAVLKGFGRADLQTLISAVNFTLAVIATWVFAPFGLLAVAIAVVVRQFLTWPLSVRLVKRVSGAPMVAQLKAAAPAFAAALIMVALVFAASAVLPAATPALVRLLTMISVGALSYPVMFILLSPRESRRAYLRLARSVAIGDWQSLKRYFA